jgi:hypothetical protein
MWGVGFGMDDGDRSGKEVSIASNPDRRIKDGWPSVAHWPAAAQ